MQKKKKYIYLVHKLCQNVCGMNRTKCTVICCYGSIVLFAVAAVDISSSRCT